MNCISKYYRGYDAFVVTKPIQYINVLNIESSNEKKLLIVNSFAGFESLCSHIMKTSSYWSQVICFESLNEAFEWLLNNRRNIQTLYIDSDINHWREFFLLRKSNITVYEEGVGTYRHKQYKPRRKILGNIYLFLLGIAGFKNRRGGNRYTKSLIVYFPEFYKQYLNERVKNVLAFRKPFVKHLYECESQNIFGLNLDFSSLQAKVVGLYLTSWKVEDLEITRINQLVCDVKIIKPHPHIRNIDIPNNFDIVISAHFPAELVILQLVKVVSELIIVSQFSSSAIYFINEPKIKIVNFPLSETNYSDDESYLEAYTSINKYLIGK